MLRAQRRWPGSCSPVGERAAAPVDSPHSRRWLLPVVAVALPLAVAATWWLSRPTGLQATAESHSTHAALESLAPAVATQVTSDARSEPAPLQPDERRSSPAPEASALAAPEAAARIVGRVFGESGAPLAAAIVTAAPEGGDPFATSWSAASDRDGWYELAGVGAGSWELGVRPAGVRLGSTRAASVTVRAGEVAVVDLELRGGRSVRGAFEFASEWEEMDLSLVRVVLWRKGDRERAIARSCALTSHEEPWTSGEFRIAGLEPGAYELEAWPFVEDHQVWREELDLTSSDARLPIRALHSDRQWREREAVPPPGR